MAPIAARTRHRYGRNDSISLVAALEKLLVRMTAKVAALLQSSIHPFTKFGYRRWKGRRCVTRLHRFSEIGRSRTFASITNNSMKGNHYMCRVRENGLRLFDSVTGCVA